MTRRRGSTVSSVPGPQGVRFALATVQVSLGVLAVLLCAFSITAVVDPSDLDVARGILVAVVLGLGLVLLVVWLRARTRRRALVLLTALTGWLAGLMIVLAVREVRSAASGAAGLWGAVWSTVVDAGLWVLVVVAAVVELRLTARRSEVTPEPGWRLAASVAVPLTVITILTVLVTMAAPAWMVRVNSQVGEVATTGAGVPSSLSGEQRWTLDLDAGTAALPIRSGLAVPVAGSAGTGAGVVVLDPASGEVRWRYQLRGVDDHPELASTDGGRAVVVSFDDTPDDVWAPTFTLDAETGRVRDFWPSTGSVRSTDPPVLFDHVARGTNTVITLSPSGRTLWSYRPERCADPREASGTATVVLVRARVCGRSFDDQELIGLDARTGERRWAQPAESSASRVLAVPGALLELGGGGDSLRLRQLDTGVHRWSVPTGPRCGEDGLLDAAGQTVYVGSCRGQDDERGMVTAHALDSGAELWRSPVEAGPVAVTAVDEGRVLALTATGTTCDLRLVAEEESRTLLSLPEAGGSTEAPPGAVRCGESSVHQVGDAAVLQLALRTGSGQPARSRFVGLG